MPNPPPRRRPMGTLEKAEALFKAANDKPGDGAAKAPVVPGAKETVSLRLDRDVLDFFQDEGPGWQERINLALRKAAGLD
jgi:uncharacterized protein (DUF4415 family)